MNKLYYMVIFMLCLSVAMLLWLAMVQADRLAVLETEGAMCQAQLDAGRDKVHILLKDKWVRARVCFSKGWR